MPETVNHLITFQTKKYYKQKHEIKFQKENLRVIKNMLKKIRVIISLSFFFLLTFYFLDFAGILSDNFRILGQIQFIPAFIAKSILIVVCILISLLLFGRIYCSTVCPMGVLQDIINRISKIIFPKRKSKFRKNNPNLRGIILTVSYLLFFFGFILIFGLLDPYSAFGRIATHIFKPIYLFGNNILAAIFTNFGNYTFYPVAVEISSIFSFTVAIFTFLIIGFLAAKNGRLYCNTVCPVGTLFGFLNKYSFFKIRINENKCSTCGLCEKNCKAQCIDSQAKNIDYSRCVNCFNCIGNCKKNGISYSLKKDFTVNKIENKNLQDEQKRVFILTGLTTAITVPTVLAQEKLKPLLAENNIFNDGTVMEKTRQIPITPPGSISIQHFQKHCTSCHLCVSKCPSKVLKPAFLEYGFAGIMQPTMEFEKGFCNYNCNTCSTVCPTNAINSITLDEKRLTQVGKVVFIEELCVVHTDGTSCGACSEHCPTQAVKMIPYKNGLTIPLIDVEICVGCGGCEYICPIRPFRAIFVEGNKIHQRAKPFEIEEVEKKEITDFGF